MTKIAWISDLHFERGSRLKLFEHFDEDVDIMIIAGDLHTSAENVIMTLKKIKQIVSATLLYVPGNHEYYDSNIAHENRIFNQFIGNLSDNDIFILNRAKIVIDGINFIGAPCWPNDSFYPISIKTFPQYNDFNYISDFASSHRELGDLDIKFISDGLVVDHPNIIISHWLPLPSCISLRYISDRYNPCFTNDFQFVIDNWAEKGYDVRLWVHGHSHDAIDIELGNIRYTRNPVGYPNEQSGVNFNKYLVI